MEVGSSYFPSDEQKNKLYGRCFNQLRLRDTCNGKLYQNSLSPHIPYIYYDKNGAIVPLNNE